MRPACYSSRCGDPALLPSGGLSVSRAAEERHSRGGREESRHMLPPSSPHFPAAADLPACFPRSLGASHGQTDPRFFQENFSFSSPVSPQRVHFLHSLLYPSSPPPPCFCLCSSSSSSCLIFLETNYIALQEGKKPGGEQFRQRASCFLPFHFHEDLFFFFGLFFTFYICLCSSIIYNLSPLLFYTNQIYDFVLQSFFILIFLFYLRLSIVALKVFSQGFMIIIECRLYTHRLLYRKTAICWLPTVSDTCSCLARSLGIVCMPCCCCHVI